MEPVLSGFLSISKSIAKFHELYPGVTIHIFEEVTHKLEEAAMEGR